MLVQSGLFYECVCPCLQLGRSPMHYAAAGGQADIMKVLLAEGADAELVDKVKRNILYWIFQRAPYPHLMFACI